MVALSLGTAVGIINLLLGEVLGFPVEELSRPDYNVILYLLLDPSHQVEYL